MISQTPNGEKVTYEIEKRRKGALIYREETTNSRIRQGYNLWRSRWCNAHPSTPTPAGFREGSFERECLLFALKEGWRVR